MSFAACVGKLPNRSVAKELADRLGYFWEPCTLCGDPHAGFEWGRGGIYYKPGQMRGCCPDPVCEEAARILNQHPQRVQWARMQGGKEYNDVHFSIDDAERLAALEQARKNLKFNAASEIEDAKRYRFLRDNPLQLRAVDGNAAFCGNIDKEKFNFYVDVAKNGAMILP